MTRELYRAGMVAAGRQFLAVSLTGLAIIFLKPDCQGEFISGPAARTGSSAAPNPSRLPLGVAIAMADLLLAAGLVATASVSTNLTANLIGKVARLRLPTNPQLVVNQLVALTGISAFGCVILALRNPPTDIVSMLPDGPAEVLLLLSWPGLFSVGFAFFAATALAGLKS